MANVSDFLFERLRAWGVRRIFGYSGDGIGGLTGALQRSGDDAFDFIQVRHEEMAAFMASAHAKFTGELGVCIATAGPGAIHLLNGLYDAKQDHVPVLAIVGHAATTAIGGDYQQEVNLPALLADVAREYNVMVTSPAAMRLAVDRAVRTALAYRTVTAIVVPKDVQEMDAVPNPPHKHLFNHSGVGYRKPRTVPFDADLREAAELLNSCKRPAMLVGAGALGARDAVVAVAEKLGAGVAKALLGKAVVEDTHPLVTGTLGLLGTLPSSEMMQACDGLLLVGTSFPYAEFLPKEGQAKCVQIDVDARNMSMRYPSDINLIGDANETLLALLPLLEQTTSSDWRSRIERDKESWHKTDTARAADSASPMNPQRVFTELDARMPANAIVTADAGTTANWSARGVTMRPGMKYSLSGGLASMGSAVPYAVAGKLAFPDRVAIALAGDGAMQMNGTAELLTIAKYWKRWSDPRLVVMVLNNRDLNQVTWEQRIESGDPKYVASQDLPDMRYADYAISIGLRGVRVDDPEQMGAAWDAAFAADRPFVIDAVTDPNVPFLPPFITFEQAKNMTSAIVKGDVDDANIIVASAKSLLAELLHH